jgi:hypothetical protein
VSRGGDQRIGENPAVETCVLLGGQLTQSFQCVPLRQRRDINQVPRGCTAEQRENY